MRELLISSHLLQLLLTISEIHILCIYSFGFVVFPFILFLFSYKNKFIIIIIPQIKQHFA